MGFASLLPWNMFITATGYFYNKFVPSQSNLIIKNYESYFQITGIVSNIVPKLFIMMIIRHVRIPTMINVSNLVMLFVFLLTTILAKVNTDSWGCTFFFITLFGFCIMSAKSSIYGASMMAWTSMMHPQLIKSFFLGYGLAGLFASLTSIVTLSIPGSDSNQAGFFYFLIATICLVMSQVLFYVFQRLPYIVSMQQAFDAKSEADDISEDQYDNRLSLRQLFGVTYKYNIASFFALFYTLSIFPSILANLKSSENSADGKAWVDTYFIPVVVFLSFNMGDVVGRSATAFIRWPGKQSIMWVSIARVVFIPLLLMCNLQPRSNPMVWFTSDFWPMLMIFLFGWSNGHILSLAASYAPQDVVGDGNKASIGTIQAVAAALGLVGGSIMVFVIQPIVGL